MPKKPIISKSTKSTLPLNKVMFLRISTGEDLVSELKTETDHYILINPLRVIYAMMDHPGMIAVNLVSWVFPRVTETQEFSLYPKDIITMGEPTEKLKKFYSESLNVVSTTDTGFGGGFLGANEGDDGDEIDQYMDRMEGSKRRLN